MTVESPRATGNRPALAEIAVYAAQVGAALAEAVAGSQPNDVIHQTRQGETLTYQTIVLWIQIIDHGIEHRTNITTILNQLALPAPEVDGWSYWDGNRERYT